MGTLLTFAIVSIAFSFLCSVLEAVLLSISPTYVQMKTREGGKVGELLQRYKAEPNPPLTAILSLNTIAHTVGAILVGASTGAAFGEGLAFTIPLPEADLGLFAIGPIPVSYEVLVSIIMTLAILVISEIIPKNLGATYWKSWAPFSVKTLDILVKIFTWTGFIWLSDKLKKLILRGDDPHATALTRTEFMMVAEAHAQEGQLNEHEGRILKNLLAFESLSVHDIMTPRIVVMGAKANQTIAQVYEKFGEHPFSRLPVFGETRDQVEGYVLKDLVFQAMIEQRGEESIKSLIREILVVPEDTKVNTLMNMMLERHEPVSLVVDEFGGMEGIVTMEDAVETLLGLEIMDEMDNTSDMQEMARRRWKKRADAMGVDISKIGDDIMAGDAESIKEELEERSKENAQSDDKTTD
ncbi:hemolysin [Lewinellaceae bacterium SD302]|nr:hemolysin [Lewinellaceae bacterium SD302]